MSPGSIHSCKCPRGNELVEKANAADIIQDRRFRTDPYRPLFLLSSCDHSVRPTSHRGPPVPRNERRPIFGSNRDILEKAMTKRLGVLIRLVRGSGKATRVLPHASRVGSSGHVDKSRTQPSPLPGASTAHPGRAGRHHHRVGFSARLHGQQGRRPPPQRPNRRLPGTSRHQAIRRRPSTLLGPLATCRLRYLRPPAGWPATGP